MTERIYSDERMLSIRRSCYAAGSRGDEAYTVRGADGGDVVRCRDCAHATPGFADGAGSRTPIGCNLHYSPRTRYMPEVEPDGYCSWGERRGPSDDIGREERNGGLIPCPFCGGKAEVTEYNGGFAAVGCSNGRCYMHPHAFGFPSVDDAVEKWNRRYERTCQMEYDEEWSGDELYPTEAYSCSECGHITPDGKPRYCPGCGAKVVDEQ